MSEFDDPGIEEKWCSERRAETAAYLEHEGLNHGRIGDWPAWHIAPYVSIWAVESATRPGWVGWWAICGDLPTDYVSADTIKHPREALRTFSDKWLELSDYLARGERPPGVSIGTPEQGPELASLLKARAAVIAKWVDDDEIWKDPAP